MEQQDIFRRPIQRKKPTKGARILASWLVPGRTDMQATIQEELIAEALARTGAKSLEELIARAQTEGKIAKQFRIQVIPRPTVESPRRVAMIMQQGKAAVIEPELPSSVETALRNLDKVLTRVRTTPILTELRSELRARQRFIEMIDRAVERLKAVAQTMGVSIEHTRIRAALTEAEQERRKQLDRVLTLQQMLEEAEERGAYQTIKPPAR